MVAHVFNPSTGRQRQVAGGSMSLGPAWSIKWVSGQPELLHRETLSRKTKSYHWTQKCQKSTTLCSLPTHIYKHNKYQHTPKRYCKETLEYYKEIFLRPVLH